MQEAVSFSAHEPAASVAARLGSAVAEGACSVIGASAAHAAHAAGTAVEVVDHTASDLQHAATEVQDKVTHAVSGILQSESRTARLLDKFFPIAWERDPDQLSPFWRRTTNLVIFINVLHLGVVCQWPKLLSLAVNLTLDLATTVFYMVEVIMKWRIAGITNYFTHEAVRSWNIIDFTATATGFINLVIEVFIFFGKLGESNEVSLLGTFKLLRVLRLFRLLRYLRQVPALAIIVGGIVGSFGSLLWSLVALLLIIFLFATIFVTVISDDEHEYFGTVSKAILTLTDVVFMAVWHSDIFPPEKEEYLLAPFFLFVILTSFGVTNIIVGVIVDATFLTRERLEWKEKRGRLQDMGQLWEERIVGTGLSLEGVESASLNYKLRLQEERRHLITGILDSIVNRPDFDFPPGLTAEELYEVFDPVGDGRVNHENFVIGMGRLLLNNPFQTSVMGLVDLAINRSHLGALRQSIDDISARVACLEGVKASLASLERSVHNIERRMNASAEDASPHLTGGSSIRSASEPL